jgi:hypothetical protein
MMPTRPNTLVSKALHTLFVVNRLNAEFNINWQIYTNECRSFLLTGTQLFNNQENDI